MTSRLTVAISGASGVIYGIRMLEVLSSIKSVESHLILTQSAEINIKLETSYSVKDVKKMADEVYRPDDLAAPVSSGSFQIDGMVVIPCSIKSLSGIVNSYNDTLLTRAADVTLKEQRKLVICPRETPLHKGHVELMLKAVEYGAVLLPPFPAFYHKPQKIQDIIDQTVGKILDQFSIQHTLFDRWK